MRPEKILDSTTLPMESSHFLAEQRDGQKANGVSVSFLDHFCMFAGDSKRKKYSDGLLNRFNLGHPQFRKSDSKSSNPIGDASQPLFVVGKATSKSESKMSLDQLPSQGTGTIEKKPSEEPHGRKDSSPKNPATPTQSVAEFCDGEEKEEKTSRLKASDVSAAVVSQVAAANGVGFFVPKNTVPMSSAAIESGEPIGVDVIEPEVAALAPCEKQKGNSESNPAAMTVSDDSHPRIDIGKSSQFAVLFGENGAADEISSDQFAEMFVSAEPDSGSLFLKLPFEKDSLGSGNELLNIRNNVGESQKKGVESGEVVISSLQAEEAVERLSEDFSSGQEGQNQNANQDFSESFRSDFVNVDVSLSAAAGRDFEPTLKETYSSIKQQLIEVIENAYISAGAKCDGVAKFSLDLGEFGQLTVVVMVANDQVTVDLQAENNQTRALLLQLLPAFRNELAARGIQLETVNVGNFGANNGENATGNGSQDNLNRQKEEAYDHWKGMAANASEFVLDAAVKR